MRRSRASKKASPVVHFACSGGGHLDLLLRVHHALDDRKHVWVVEQSYRIAALREEGAEVHSLGAYHRTSPLAQLRAVWRTLRIFARERPQLVVTAGAGIVVLYCLLARLAGAYIVFIETSARVRGPSSSGRILSRLADHVIVQWEEMALVYPGAVVARTSTLDEFTESPSAAGQGVFVGVGTQWQPFDRLIAMVDRAAGEGHLPRPVFLQVGHSTYPVQHGETRTYITPSEMDEMMSAASYVICHAGVGTISAALRVGRRPLVLPRLSKHGEHWDDHQEQIVEKLADHDLVVRLGDEIRPEDLATAERPLMRSTHLGNFPPVTDCLRGHLREVEPRDR
jgi:UDP-N-acetylglucosamine transferase subunit ALG13